MKTLKETGGNAFPQIKSAIAYGGGPSNEHDNYANVYSEDGMNLRDYFAGQALIGTLINENIADKDIRETCSAAAKEKDIKARNITAYYCYQIADAMIIERDK